MSPFTEALLAGGAFIGGLVVGIVTTLTVMRLLVTRLRNGER